MRSILMRISCCHTNVHIIVCGLNSDRNQKKFGFILDLIPIANKIPRHVPKIKPYTVS